MSSDGEAPARYGEENAIALDKWIYGVCGADGLQFPAHRRAQFPAYMTRVQSVVKQKEFVAGTFVYPSRAGPREVLTLQYTLEALGNREKAFLRKLHETETHIATVKATLEERTMGMSALPPSAMSRSPTPLPGGASSTSATASASASASTTSQPVRGLAEGYQPLEAPSSARPPARGDDRRARYAEKKSIAARYVEQRHKDIAAMEAQQRDVIERHASIKTEEDQLRKECQALKETEDIVLERQEDTEQHLAALRERAAAEEQRAAQRHEGRAARLAAAVAAITSEFDTDAAAPITPNSPEGPALRHTGDDDNEEDDLPEHQLALLDVSEETEPVQGGGASGAAALDSDTHDTVSSSSSNSNSNHDSDKDKNENSHNSSHSEVAPTAPTGPEEVTGPHSHPNSSQASETPSEVGAAPAHVESLGDATLVVAEDAHGEGPIAPSSSADPTPTPTHAPVPAPAPEPVEGRRPSAPPPAQPRRTAAELEAARVAQLERLRHELSDAGTRRQELMRTMRNESQVHLGRLRQSRQRLRDWQDIVEARRRASEQLQGQVRVLTQVVEDTTERLEAAEVANRGGASGSYGGHLARLNELLKQRTVEQYQTYVGSTDGSAAEAALAAEEEKALLRPLQRPAPGASGANTPARRYSGSSATPSPARDGVSEASWTTHRSRYDLVRHLQRWEKALQLERAQLRQAVGLNGQTGATEKTLAPRDSYQQLRAMLLQS